MFLLEDGSNLCCQEAEEHGSKNFLKVTKQSFCRCWWKLLIFAIISCFLVVKYLRQTTCERTKVISAWGQKEKMLYFFFRFSAKQKCTLFLIAVAYVFFFEFFSFGFYPYNCTKAHVLNPFNFKINQTLFQPFVFRKKHDFYFLLYTTNIHQQTNKYLEKQTKKKPILINHCGNHGNPLSFNN